MSTTTPRRLVAGVQLPAAVGTQYTVPANTRAIIKASSLINTTAGVVPCTVYLVPSGGAVGAATTVISARNIAVGETYNCPELVNQVLEAGATIQSFGLNVTFNVSGVEIVS